MNISDTAAFQSIMDSPEGVATMTYDGVHTDTLVVLVES
jgi:hypothetical protein